MKETWSDEYIQYYENILPQDFCLNQINVFEDDFNKSSIYDCSVDTEIDGTKQSIREGRELAIGQLASMPTFRFYDEREHILEYIMPLIDSYLNKNPIFNFVGMNFEASFLDKYEKGKGYYEYHWDDDGPNIKDRLLTIIIFLNTVEKGGEIEFKDRNKIFKVSQGSILIFPSNKNFIYKITKPISNDMYILLNFLKEEHQFYNNPGELKKEYNIDSFDFKKLIGLEK